MQAQPESHLETLLILHEQPKYRFSLDRLGNSFNKSSHTALQASSEFRDLWYQVLTRSLSNINSVITDLPSLPGHPRNLRCK